MSSIELTHPPLTALPRVVCLVAALSLCVVEHVIERLLLLLFIVYLFIAFIYCFFFNLALSCDLTSDSIWYSLQD